MIISSCILFYAFDWNWDVISKETMAQKFDEMNKQIKMMQTYSVSVEHSSFENYTTNVAYEKSVGYFKKDKNNYHSYLLGIHTIQNSNCKIVINDAYTIIAVANPDHSLENSLTQADYTTLLNICSSIKKMQINNETRYRLEFAEENPLSACEFVLNQNELLSKIIIYYNREVKREDNTTTKPRIEIIFSDWKKNNTYNKQEFDESKYVYKKGEQYFLKQDYARKYQLLDQRVVIK